MASNTTSPSFRLWPGILIVILQWTLTFVPGLMAPATMIQGFALMCGPAAGLLLLLFVWWLFASRVVGREKLYGVALPLIFLVATFAVADPSAPMGIYIYGVPMLCTAFVIWAWLSRGRSATVKLVSLLATLTIVCGGWALVRMEGVDGDMAAQFSYRFQPTPEERLLAMEETLPTRAPAPADDASGASNEAAAPAHDALDDAAMDASSVDDEPSDAAVAGSADAAATDPTALADTTATNDTAANDTTANDSTANDSTSPPTVTSSTTDPAWPGFRGPQRDGIVRGVGLASDWQTATPVELWKRPVGPGWSSFAIWKELLYTQEQRGDDEVVSAYDLATGQPVWQHRDAVRFWEAMAGAGPRATPTVHDGRVYALGATGLLNVLDAADGTLEWSRNVAEDTGAPTPEWGFSSSPLVTRGMVIVHTGGPDGKGVVAYDVDGGEPLWFAPAGPMSYSSVHVAELGGVEQLVILTGDGAEGLSLAGEPLWQHAWPMPGARIVQPVMTDDSHLFVGTGFGLGVRRLAVTSAEGAWTVEEQWTSTGLKPYYNDFVLHGGYLYGFDGRILSCVDAATGERQWKGGRYGNGQLLLLADQDLLLVLTDRGDIALVSARPEGFEEVARMPAIEGKTWNHPAIADGVLYVRNAEEMAAYRLPQSTTTATTATTARLR